MRKWNLIINVGRCENCYNCVIADRDEHVGNDYPGYAASASAASEAPIRILRRVQGQAPMVETTYLPVMCNHCDNAPCVKACPVQATWNEPDGIVVVDYNWCIGCRYCEAACPYHARRFNWSKPEVPAAEVNPDQAYLSNRIRPVGGDGEVYVLPAPHP